MTNTFGHATVADRAVTTTTQNIDSIVLKRGVHSNREQGVCLLEAVAWMAGEPHSDRPQCVDVALAAYGRAINDRLQDDERQLLRPLIPLLINTRGSQQLARRRAYYLVDRYFRVQLPALFRALSRPDLAERFEALEPVIDEISAERARHLVSEVRADIWRSLPSAAHVAASATHVAVAAVADAADAAAAAAAADAADAVADANAFDAFDAFDLPELRRKTIERAIAAFREAIALSDAAQEVQP